MPDEHAVSFKATGWQTSEQCSSYTPLFSGFIRRSFTLSGLFFPKVHAAEAEAVVDGGSAISAGALTTIERLATAPQTKVMLSDAEVLAFIERETPQDRLRAMYSRNELGEYSHEVQMIGNLVTNSSGLIFLLTSVLGGFAAREAFVAKNKHVTYETKFQAIKAYNDALFFGGLRMGLLWGFKSAIFTSIFMFVSQSIAVYRNRTSIVEYIAGGSVTCAVLRIDVGLKGMFAGGVIGGALGLVAGLGFNGLLYLVDETQQKRHYWQVQEMLRAKKEQEILFSKEMQSLSIDGTSSTSGNEVTNNDGKSTETDNKKL